MRLTQVLFKVSHRFRLKTLWRRRGTIKVPHPYVPEYLVKKGIPVVDATELVDDSRPRLDWEPPVPDDPRFLDRYGPGPIEQHPDYHEDPVYEFTPSCKLTGGLNQACVLTKTQLYDGLPESVEQLIGAASVPQQDELVQRYIYQANVWDPTKDKLPRRHNPDLPGWRFKAEWGIPQNRIMSILCRRLVRLCQMIAAQDHDISKTCTLSHDHKLDSYFNHGADPSSVIRVKAEFDTLLSSDRPLPAFASEDIVDDTASQSLPEIYPVLPTIDIPKQHIYKDVCSTGWRDDFSHVYPRLTLLPHHTNWHTHQTLAVGVILAHCQALATARQTHGHDISTLPSPVSTQFILTDGSVFHFICYQLNTLLNSTPHGVKNQVWIDSNNHLYQKILPKRAMLRNTLYQDYDAEVFKKMLAMCMNGGDRSSSQARS